MTCSSCGAAIEFPGGKAPATVVCPRCGRRAVARDVELAPPVGAETVPIDVVTGPLLEPMSEADSTAQRRPVARASLPPGKRVSLAFLNGPRAGDVVAVALSRLTIGRVGGGSGADLELDDPQVSRAHAAIECHGSRIVLQDLGSSNGTWLGDERIESRELEDRAEFRVGSTCLMLIVTDTD
jgi:DNA-directed RNA polymerase subunit RPC12/RpoP